MSVRRIRSRVVNADQGMAKADPYELTEAGSCLRV
jgi:hypothetical protein